MSLLPPKSTPLERALERATPPGPDPELIRTLWNPAVCPAHLLPWLAWTLSVDDWDDRWDEPTRRRVIASSIPVHRRKGTVGAVRRAIAPHGVLQRVVEWWEMHPPGVPGTFALEVNVSDRGISEETFAELERLIARAKPRSRPMRGLAIALAVRGAVHIGAAAQDGEILTVYPYAPGPIEVGSQALLFGGAEHSIDTLSVYP